MSQNNGPISRLVNQSINSVVKPKKAAPPRMAPTAADYLLGRAQVPQPPAQAPNPIANQQRQNAQTVRRMSPGIDRVANPSNERRVQIRANTPGTPENTRELVRRQVAAFPIDGEMRAEVEALVDSALFIRTTYLDPETGMRRRVSPLASQNAIRQTGLLDPSDAMEVVALAKTPEGRLLLKTEVEQFRAQRGRGQAQAKELEALARPGNVDPNIAGIGAVIDAATMSPIGRAVSDVIQNDPANIAGALGAGEAVAGAFQDAGLWTLRNATLPLRMLGVDPDAIERGIRQFGQSAVRGFAGGVSSMTRIPQLLGSKEWADLSDAIDKGIAMRDADKPLDDTFFNEIGRAAGGVVAQIAPALITGGSSIGASVAGRMVASAAFGVTEAMSNAASGFDRAVKEGQNIEEARQRAARALPVDMIVSTALNRFGEFSDLSPLWKKMFASSFTEGVQEWVQTGLEGYVATGEMDLSSPEAIKGMALGAALGPWFSAGIDLATGTQMEGGAEAVPQRSAAASAPPASESYQAREKEYQAWEARLQELEALLERASGDTMLPNGMPNPMSKTAIQRMISEHRKSRPAFFVIGGSQPSAKPQPRTEPTQMPTREQVAAMNVQPPANVPNMGALRKAAEGVAQPQTERAEPLRAWLDSASQDDIRKLFSKNDSDVASLGLQADVRARVMALAEAQGLAGEAAQNVRAYTPQQMTAKTKNRLAFIAKDEDGGEWWTNTQIALLGANLKTTSELSTDMTKVIRGALDGAKPITAVATIQDYTLDLQVTVFSDGTQMDARYWAVMQKANADSLVSRGGGKPVVAIKDGKPVAMVMPYAATESRANVAARLTGIPPAQLRPEPAPSNTTQEKLPNGVIRIDTNNGVRYAKAVNGEVPVGTPLYKTAEEAAKSEPAKPYVEPERKPVPAKGPKLSGAELAAAGAKARAEKSLGKSIGWRIDGQEKFGTVKEFADDLLKNGYTPRTEEETDFTALNRAKKIVEGTRGDRWGYVSPDEKAEIEQAKAVIANPPKKTVYRAYAPGDSREFFPITKAQHDYMVEQIESQPAQPQQRTEPTQMPTREQLAAMNVQPPANVPDVPSLRKVAEGVSQDATKKANAALRRKVQNSGGPSQQDVNALQREYANKGYAITRNGKDQYIISKANGGYTSAGPGRARFGLLRMYSFDAVRDVDAVTAQFESYEAEAKADEALVEYAKDKQPHELTYAEVEQFSKASRLGEALEKAMLERYFYSLPAEQKRAVMNSDEWPSQYSHRMAVEEAYGSGLDVPAKVLEELGIIGAPRSAYKRTNTPSPVVAPNPAPKVAEPTPQPKPVTVQPGVFPLSNARPVQKRDHIVALYPHRVGGKFSPSDIEAVKEWARLEEATVAASPTVITVTGPLGKDWAATAVKSVESVRGLTARQARNKAAIDQYNQQTEAKDAANKAYIAAHPNEAAWLANVFGEGFANDYNLASLIRYLVGDAKQFGGLMTPSWVPGLAKLGLSRDNASDMKRSDIAAVIKKAWESQPQDTPRKVAEGVARDTQAETPTAKEIGFDDIVVVSSPDGRLQRVGNVRGVANGNVTVWMGDNQITVPANQVRLASEQEAVYSLGTRIDKSVQSKIAPVQETSSKQPAATPAPAITRTVEEGPDNSLRTRGFDPFNTLPLHQITRAELQQNEGDTGGAKVPKSKPVLTLEAKWREAQRKVDDFVQSQILSGNRDYANNALYLKLEDASESAGRAYRLKREAEIDAAHYRAVEQALQRGLPVPPEVLADYPDLAAKYQSQDTPAKAPESVSPGVQQAEGSTAGVAARNEQGQTLEEIKRAKQDAGGRMMNDIIARTNEREAKVKAIAAKAKYPVWQIFDGSFAIQPKKGVLVLWDPKTESFLPFAKAQAEGHTARSGPYLDKAIPLNTHAERVKQRMEAESASASKKQAEADAAQAKQAEQAAQDAKVARDAASKVAFKRGPFTTILSDGSKQTEDGYTFTHPLAPDISYGVHKYTWGARGRKSKYIVTELSTGFRAAEGNTRGDAVLNALRVPLEKLRGAIARADTRSTAGVAAEPAQKQAKPRTQAPQAQPPAEAQPQPVAQQPSAPAATQRGDLQSRRQQYLDTLETDDQRQAATRHYEKVDAARAAVPPPVLKWLDGATPEQQTVFTLSKTRAETLVKVKMTPEEYRDAKYYAEIMASDVDPRGRKRFLPMNEADVPVPTGRTMSNGAQNMVTQPDANGNEWWTDSHMATRGIPKGVLPPAKQERKPEIQRVIPKEFGERVTPSAFVRDQDRPGTDAELVVILSNGARVNAKRWRFLQKNVPGIAYYTQENPNRTIVAHDADGNPVALLMPMQFDEEAAKLAQPATATQPAPKAAQSQESARPQPATTPKPELAPDTARMQAQKQEATKARQSSREESARRKSAEGFAALPERSRAEFDKRMASNSVDDIASMLHPSNKSFRAEFERRTGVTLPSTVSGTKQAVANWVQAQPQDTPAKAPESVSPGVQQAEGSTAGGRSAVAAEIDEWVSKAKPASASKGVTPGKTMVSKDGRYWTDTFIGMVIPQGRKLLAPMEPTHTSKDLNFDRVMDYGPGANEGVELQRLGEMSGKAIYDGGRLWVLDRHKIALVEKYHGNVTLRAHVTHRDAISAFNSKGQKVAVIAGGNSAPQDFPGTDWASIANVLRARVAESGVKASSAAGVAETTAQEQPATQEQVVYRYAPRLRPPSPGAVPREGLIGTARGGEWGVAEYNRELTPQEIRDYELDVLPPRREAVKEAPRAMTMEEREAVTIQGSRPDYADIASLPEGKRFVYDPTTESVYDADLLRNANAAKLGLRSNAVRFGASLNTPNSYVEKYGYGRAADQAYAVDLNNGKATSAYRSAEAHAQLLDSIQRGQERQAAQSARVETEPKKPEMWTDTQLIMVVPTGFKMPKQAASKAANLDESRIARVWQSSSESPSFNRQGYTLLKETGDGDSKLVNFTSESFGQVAIQRKHISLLTKAHGNVEFHMGATDRVVLAFNQDGDHIAIIAPAKLPDAKPRTQAQQRADAKKRDAALQDLVYGTPGAVIEKRGYTDTVVSYDKKQGTVVVSRTEAGRNMGQFTLMGGLDKRDVVSITAPDGTVLYGNRKLTDAAKERVEAMLTPKKPKPQSPAEPKVAKEMTMGRSRPVDQIDLDVPIVGPSGAKLTSYRWQWKESVEWNEGKQDFTEKRVSNWDAAVANLETGRDIVHQFVVEMPDGGTRVVSLETAAKVLGFNEPNASLKSAASSLKTRAKNLMRRQLLQAQLDAWDAAYARAEAIKLPEPQFRDGQSAVAQRRGLQEISVDGGDTWHIFNQRHYSRLDEINLAVRQWREDQAERESGVSSFKASSIRAEIKEIDKRIAKQAQQATPQSPAEPKVVGEEDGVRGPKGKDVLLAPVVAETDKAVQVQVRFVNKKAKSGKRERFDSIWVPKSMISNGLVDSKFLSDKLDEALARHRQATKYAASFDDWRLDLGYVSRPAHLTSAEAAALQEGVERNEDARQWINTQRAKIANNSKYTRTEGVVKWKEVLEGAPDSVKGTDAYKSAVAEFNELFGKAYMPINLDPQSPDILASPSKPAKSKDTITVDGKERPRTNSNGQPIHPTEEGIRAFWRWFGGSKIVDEQGRPLVVYHGSPDMRFMGEDATFKSQAERFGGRGESTHAHWFASDTRTAKSYADDRRAYDYQNAEPGVIPAYLKALNPLVIDAQGQYWRDAQRRGQTADVIDEARNNGHDGVIIRNVKDDYNNSKATKPTTTLTVFSPTQIKSAIGNQGTFSPDNPSILASPRRVRRGMAPEPIKWEVAALPYDGPSIPLSDLRIDLEQAFGKLRTGTSAKGTKGVYVISPDIKYVRYGNDVVTAAHEIAHQLDARQGITNNIAGPALDQLRSGYFDRTIPENASQEVADMERFAVLVEAYVSDPERLKALTPELFGWMEKILPPKSLTALQNFSTKLRQYAGQSATAKASSSFVMGRQVNPVQRTVENIKAGSVERFTDNLTQGWLDQYGALLRSVDRIIGGGDRKEGARKRKENPLMDWEVALRDVPYTDEMFTAQMQEGFIDRRLSEQTGSVVTAPSFVQLVSHLEPGTDKFEENYRKATAYMNALRHLDWADRKKSEAEANIEAYTDAVNETKDAAIAQKRLDLMTKAVENGASNVALAIKPELDAYTKRITSIAKQKITRFSNAERKHAIRMGEESGLVAMGPGIKSTVEEARRALKELEPDMKMLRAFEKDYRALSDYNLNMLVWGGRLTPDQAATIRANNPHWFAVIRIDDREASLEEVVRAHLRPTRSIFGARNLVHSFQGSQRTKDDPLAALATRMRDVMQESHRNRALAQMTYLLKNAGFADGMEGELNRVRLEDGIAPTENQFTIWVNGEKQVWEVSKENSAVLQSMRAISMQGEDGKTLEAILRVLSKPASITRNLIINAPPFIVRNLTRDTIHRMTMVENFGPGAKVPKQSGLAESMGVGLGRSTIFEDPDSFVRRQKDALDDLTSKGHVVLRGRRAYQNLRESAEMVNRKAVFDQAYRAFRASGYNEYQATTLAAYAARESMTDFKKIGSNARALSQIIPFFSAQIAGTSTSMRQLGKNPAQVIKKLTVYSAVLMGLEQLWTALGGDDEEKELERLNNLDRYQRELFWNFRVGGDDGFWLSIPKGHEQSIYTTMVGQLAASLNEGRFGKPDSNRVPRAFVDNLLPVSTLPDAFGGWLPLVELVFNKKTFNDREIVPDYERNKEMSRRNIQYASPIGKALHGFLGVDARQWDYALEEMTGYYGRAITGMAEAENPDDAGRILLRFTGLNMPGSPTQNENVIAVDNLLRTFGKRPTGWENMKKAFFNAKTEAERQRAGRALVNRAKIVRERLEAWKPLPDEARKANVDLLFP